MDPELSIIIPAYNEATRIPKTLHSIYEEFKENIEVIVVSNGSTDGTPEVVNTLAKKYKNLKCMEYKQKLGKGRALSKGFEIAKGDKIGFVDADEAFDIKGVRYLIRLTGEVADCIIASKWKGQRFREINEPFTRKILSRGWNLIARWFFFLDYYDTQAGAKFFTKQVYENINKDFVCNGFGYDVEFLYRIKEKNFKIEEYYIPNKFVAGSTFGMRYILQMFFNSMKFRFKTFFEK